MIMETLENKRQPLEDVVFVSRQKPQIFLLKDDHETRLGGNAFQSFSWGLDAIGIWSISASVGMMFQQLSQGGMPASLVIFCWLKKTMICACLYETNT